MTPAPPRALIAGAGRRTILGGLLGLAACRTASTDRSIARPIEAFETPAGCQLEALGGIHIDRERLGFGGLSGLVISDDLQLSAISDTGRWMQARLLTSARGAPLGLEAVTSGVLKDGSGRPLTIMHQHDAESLALLPDGRFLVGFERWHRIRVFRALDEPGSYIAGPPGLEAAPHNGGLESLTVLADGRWLAIAESLSGIRNRRQRAAWLQAPEGDWRRVAYLPAPGFNPSDACGLADGGALVLERAYSMFGGFDGRLVRVSAAALAEPVIEGEEILRLQAPLPVDNWEGVATFRAAGRDCVALLSDDNERNAQRSLLLVMAWK